MIKYNIYKYTINFKNKNELYKIKRMSTTLIITDYLIK